MPLSRISTERRGTVRKHRASSRNARRIALVVVSAVALAGILLLPDARRFVKESGDFQLAALELKGLHRLSGNQVLEASGLVVGDNIFAVDLNDIAAKLEALVWIKTARIQRKPPDRLAIVIEERHRLAWVAHGGQTYGVDEESVLLPGDAQSGETVPDLDLPVVRGAGNDTFANEGAITDSTLVRVIDWLTAANAVDRAFCKNLSQAEALGRSDIRLRLVGDGLEVRMPGGQVEEWLPALKQILARVYRDVQTPGFVDLRFAGQVVVGAESQATESARASSRIHSPKPKEGAGYG